MARFNTALNRWLRGEDVTPVASAARTTTGATGTLDAEGFSVLSLLLDVTAKTGTPTLDVAVEESDDGTTWRAVGAFAQKTIVSAERKSFTISAAKYRVTWTIGGGTPNITFSVSGTAK